MISSACPERGGGGGGFWLRRLSGSWTRTGPARPGLSALPSELLQFERK